RDGHARRRRSDEDAAGVPGGRRLGRGGDLGHRDAQNAGGGRTGAMNDYDVVQVGYGPVGQAMAALLGSYGHRVGVFERHPTLYALPRAGHVDDEIMRVFQAIGIAGEFAERAWAMKKYWIVDANRELLQLIDWDYEGVSGWRGHYLMYQP